MAIKHKYSKTAGGRLHQIYSKSNTKIQIFTNADLARNTMTCSFRKDQLYILLMEKLRKEVAENEKYYAANVRVHVKLDP
jgi:hypothetical protein